MVEQVYYSNWGQTLEEGHKNYWEDIGDIAQMIGNDLISPYQMNYYIPEGEDYLKQMSSIAVLQTKEKFGEVRVYCSIGCESIISKKYAKHVSEVTKKNNQWAEFLRSQIKPPGYSSWWEKTMRAEYPISPKDFDVFSEEEVFSDIQHYRNTYMKYVRLFPHYKRSIISAADYGEYILDGKEDAKLYIEKMHKDLNESIEKFSLDEEIVSLRMKSIIDCEKNIRKLYDI